MTSSYERWEALSDREAIGEALTDEERAFMAEFARPTPGRRPSFFYSRRSPRLRSRKTAHGIARSPKQRCRGPCPVT